MPEGFDAKTSGTASKNQPDVAQVRNSSFPALKESPKLLVQHFSHMKKALLISSVLMFAVPFISSASSFTITAGASTGGSISPSGAVSVVSGGSQSFSTGATAGYRLTDVSVDGSSVGTPDSYAFDNVTADHSINVTAVSQEGGGLLYCSGPMAPGWNVSLPNGGCPVIPVPVYGPSVMVQNANGGTSLMSATEAYSLGYNTTN